jgi:hypothetical protein
MWLDKLSWGVLRVLTPLGPRYVKPSFGQRLYLLWIFRNFHTLPAKVLSGRQQKWIDGICAMHGFASLIEPSGLSDIPLLGTLEQRPPLEQSVAVPSRRPSQSVPGAMPPFVADAQQHP